MPLWFSASQTCSSHSHSLTGRHAHLLSHGCCHPPRHCPLPPRQSKRCRRPRHDSHQRDKRRAHPTKARASMHHDLQAGSTCNKAAWPRLPVWSAAPRVTVPTGQASASPIFNGKISRQHYLGSKMTPRCRCCCYLHCHRLARHARHVIRRRNPACAKPMAKMCARLLNVGIWC